MMQDTRYGIQDTGYRIHDGYKMHGTRVPGSCTLHRVSCIILLLFASCILHPASAQLYPVQSTLQITPPYSLTLADYVAPGSEKVALNIFLADVNRPELSVRLRLRIEGVGIRIETKAEYLPEPMMISGGVPLRLIGADLVDYFDPRNLNFSGITQREYEQKAALPEGLYQFTFEVIEYNRGVKISNSATVMAWLILNDPPLINLPKDNDKIRIQSPQQVIFQWTPRHTGSPNSAFSTEYEFLLVEVWPSTRNPNDAILTSPAIFETTTAASTLIYGPAETPLEPGRRYAFRIKAKSIVGVDELNLFKNNGYSQVSTFVYGDACTLPTGIQAEVISSSKIGFAWDTQDNHTGYNIKYRLANTPNAAWYTNTSALNDIEINSLQPATTYEYQVAAACGSYDSEYSPVATVTTNEAQAITYSCGLPLNPFDLDPSQLIESLKTGDVIQAGDFDVKLTEVSGSNGIFTGKGVIEVPFFNKARLQASFSSISVNKELRMVAGSMNITGGGVDVIPAGVMDMMDELTEALALADSALNLVESNLPQPFDPYSFVADKEVKIPGTITSVIKGANGGVVVTASNGTEQTIPAGGTTAITDSNGNGYLIDSKGNIHPTTAAIASAAARREYNLNVNFAKATDTRFGFDAKKHDALLTTYEHVKDTYYASWKSIATGQTDNALALLEGTNVDKTKIHFEQSGQAVTANTQSPSPNTQVLNIKGIADGVQESVVALYTPADTTQKEQVLGKLNVVTYNQIDKHVVIVPVNGNTFDKFGSVAILQDSLNKIYNQGIVNWTVELKAGITVEGIAPFEDGGTGLLSNFTSHMKKVINAYKENTTPDTYYLFLVSNPQDPSTLGVMPRSKEYGFIFADKHSTLPEVARTIAHELGHGAFNLHHTFMEPNYTITKGTTDNLMDYPAGPKLYKYQWDKIRYPDIVVGVFESDDEAASKGDNGLAVPIDPTTIVLNQNSVFYSISGKSFVLPEGASLLFQCVSGDLVHSKPYLKRFKVGTKIFEFKAEPSGRGFIDFTGYVNESNPSEYYSSISLPTGQSEYDLYLTTQYANASDESQATLILSKIIVSTLPEIHRNGLSENEATEFLDQSKDGKPETKIDEKTFVYDCTDPVEYFKKLTEKIQKGLEKHPNTVYIIENCTTGSSQTVKATGVNSVQNKNVITLTYCNGSLSVKTVVYPTLQRNSKLTGVTQAQLEAEVKTRLNEELAAAQQRNTGKAPSDGTMSGVVNPPLPKMENGENMKIDKSDLWSFLPEVVDLGESVYENAALPEKYWNPSEGNYQQSPIQMPGIIAGVSDGLLGEATESLQMIKFGLNVATNPDIIKETWAKVKTLNTDQIKNLMVGAVEGKIGKYKQGGPVMYHEAGADGVVVAVAVLTWLKKLTDAKKILESADDGIADASKIIDDLPDGVKADIDLFNPETGAALLKDLADDNLRAFVKENPLIMKAWTKHKFDYDKLSELEKADIDEVLGKALNDSNISAKVNEWAGRSDGYKRLVNNRILGNKFGDNVSSYYKTLNKYDGVFDQIHLKFKYNGTNPKFAEFVGKDIESIADNILIENVNGKIKFIYSESKLGTGVLSKQQEMLTEMIKTGNFKAEVRSAKNLTNSSLIQTSQKISFDQINLFKGQDITDITQPIINWTK